MIFKLTLVGRGEDKKYLEKLINEYGFQSSVIFMDAIPNSELCSEYNQNDIFALPISYGGVCIPALEATACGLAVIYPRDKQNRIPEPLQQSAFIVQNTVSGFSEALTLLNSDRELLRKYKSKSRLNFSKFSGEKMENAEIDNYYSLLNFAK